jgi:hypothetical protein
LQQCDWERTVTTRITWQLRHIVMVICHNDCPPHTWVEDIDISFGPGPTEEKFDRQEATTFGLWMVGFIWECKKPGE